MLEDELREHHNFLKFQLAAETHAKKVGELQVEVLRCFGNQKDHSYLGNGGFERTQTDGSKSGGPTGARRCPETVSISCSPLQVEVERLQYEKDTTMYNLSKAKRRTRRSSKN